jgi:hypothetical protein
MYSQQLLLIVLIIVRLDNCFIREVGIVFAKLMKVGHGEEKCNGGLNMGGERVG